MEKKFKEKEVWENIKNSQFVESQTKFWHSFLWDFIGSLIRIIWQGSKWIGSFYKNLCTKYPLKVNLIQLLIFIFLFGFQKIYYIAEQRKLEDITDHALYCLDQKCDSVSLSEYAKGYRKAQADSQKELRTKNKINKRLKPIVKKVQIKEDEDEKTVSKESQPQPITQKQEDQSSPAK